MQRQGAQSVPEMFRFQMEMKDRTLSAKQLSEEVFMKPSPSLILKLKEENSSSLVPDISLGDRSWQDEEEKKTVQRNQEKLAQGP